MKKYINHSIVNSKNEQDLHTHVLIVAYACEPFATSEPGVGWNFVWEIAKFSRITVVTRSNNKPIIEQSLAGPGYELQERVEWIFVDLNAVARWLKKRLPFGVQIYYSLWQWKAFFSCHKACRTRDIDLTHHLTYGVSWMAPPLSLIKLPFIWGPIGGGDLVPQKIMAQESLTSRLQEILYAILSRGVVRISPLSWLARKRARAVLFRTRSTEKSYPATPNANRYIVSETAMHSGPISNCRASDGFIKAVSIGRMQYWKGFRYAAEGFHEYIKRGGEGQLTFLGHGPEYEFIRRYCEKHRLLEKYIKLPGKVAPDVVQTTLDESDVLIHPSFRDGGSWAVLEAMAKGLPPICIKVSGLADIVDEESGIPIDASNPQEVTDGIAEALIKVQRDSAWGLKLGAGARRRVESHYSWENKGKQLQDIYSKLLIRS